ncbi:hypothetical protein M0R45_016903 [Rubus argutus]|uniref:Uncharacterized protein n=1 Tax=Rubus argutus TaxID=59490 RepID=A0AAW1XUP1_RUBAR
MGLICNGKMRVVRLDLQLEYECGKDHVRVLPTVLGEAKPVRNRPMAEIGGDKLRFEQIRVELASVAPIGAISHGWAEWEASDGGLELSTKWWCGFGHEQLCSNVVVELRL